MYYKDNVIPGFGTGKDFEIRDNHLWCFVKFQAGPHTSWQENHASISVVVVIVFEEVVYFFMPVVRSPQTHSIGLLLDCLAMGNLADCIVKNSKSYKPLLLL